MADDKREDIVQPEQSQEPSKDAPAKESNQGTGTDDVAVTTPPTGSTSETPVTKSATITSDTPKEKHAAEPAPATSPPAEKSESAAKPVVKATPAKAAKAPPPPDPRVEQAIKQGEGMKEAIEKKLGAGTVEEVTASKTIPILRIAAQKWREAMMFLRDDPDQQFDYVELFSGTDYKDYIEVVMYVHSMTHGTYISVKTRTPRDMPVLPSLTPVYSGVNWEEREVFDLLGVTFEGHPDLRRIMMWEGWDGYPLRKDYSEFQNMPQRGGEPR
ncbi:NADH-quinone oxidoreductase subunit C [Sulfoacidibacillus ferrooxidans]|uniref:NADH-quinone oxidoreductase n=1 Tax=Sulfoacidibacillus ferrooxidans TaxID=2005001 RepID=A0A9X1V9J7_9BACL|nr:NADH-quinone oxidoreductase subunit C [Sulfoacidibacillus ferrooxidans]MCI0183379.1 NAD(P)H-quinone oxidoreductase subunit J, chloroplastic [Sulfoacidibacillus ferrooxidans]